MVDRTDYETQTGLWTFQKVIQKMTDGDVLQIALTYKLGKNAVMAKKGKYDAGSGRYHLRWANPQASDSCSLQPDNERCRFNCKS